MGKILNIVILGYYDAYNAGDEAFKYVFRSILNKELYHLEFVQPVDRLKKDPNWKIPCCTHCVIVGGGDIINDYFMPSIRKLLIDFQGPRLAIGVGVSYPDCAPYLKTFDRVIVRSQADYEMAQPYVENTYLEKYPDLSVFLDRKQQLPAKKAYLKLTEAATTKPPLRISVCIAEPCLATAYEHGAQLTQSITESIIKIAVSLLGSKGVPKIILTFVPFNTNSAQLEECDSIAIEKVRTQVLLHEDYPHKLSLHVLDDVVAQDTEKLFQHFVQDCDFVIAMRFHSVLFALISGTPFVALYSTPKIANLLSSIGISESSHENHRMQYVDTESHTPKSFEVAQFVESIVAILQGEGTLELEGRSPFASHSNNEFASHIRKLIRSKPLFPVITAQTGFELRFLDEHYLNRLTKGVVSQYLFNQKEATLAVLNNDSQALDDILDDQDGIRRLVPEDAGTEKHYQVADELCAILLTRMHQNHTETTNFMDLSPTYNRTVQAHVYAEYLHGFAEKLSQNDQPSLRSQLSWIAVHHFRNLHPSQHPLPAHD